MIQAEATARYVRTSAQKAGLVLALIRGKDVNQALATLKFTRKAIAEDISKVLRSAIANATNKEGFSGDVDRLFVSACYANQGPSAKRVRPAPMGRAFRVLKRTIAWPRGETAEDIFTVGNARPLDQALQHATTEMLRWLAEDYGLDARAASHLMGQVVRYDVGNVFNPAYTVACRIAKRWLTKL